MIGEAKQIRKPFHCVLSEIDELWSDTQRRFRTIWSRLGVRGKLLKEMKTDGGPRGVKIGDGK